jgi:hypothetical protein
VKSAIRPNDPPGEILLSAEDHGGRSFYPTIGCAQLPISQIETRQSFPAD